MIMTKLLGLFGLVRCDNCNKFTQPSIEVGKICSIECYVERKKNQ